jgi:hypothetical protein
MKETRLSLYRSQDRYRFFVIPSERSESRDLPLSRPITQTLNQTDEEVS